MKGRKENLTKDAEKKRTEFGKKVSREQGTGQQHTRTKKHGKCAEYQGEKSPVQKKREKQRTEQLQELSEDILIGRNAVMEAILGGRGINRLLLLDGEREGSVGEIIRAAKERGIRMEFSAKSKIDAIALGHRHQGVLAYVAPVAYTSLEEILERAEERGEAPFLLLLDELEDPHNLGALLRTADAVGVHGVLLPKRRSVPLNATVAKTSAGAIEYVPVAQIGNIAQTIRSLKEKNIWVAGADMDGEDYTKANFTGGILIIVGNEGHGISRLTKESCDFLVRIPMQGTINSLNASVAGSILLYEAARQRRKTWNS